MNKNKVFKRLNEEAEKAGLSQIEFAAVLDKQATPRIGTAYAFGLITGLHANVSNKETVCRYIREWRLIQRQRSEQN